MDDCVVYAIDIGSVYMRGGVHLDGITRSVVTQTTPRATRNCGGEQSLLNAISAMVRKIETTAPPMQALAVSSGGIMTLKSKPEARGYGPFQDVDLYVLASNISGLRHIPLLSRLEELGFGVPIHVENGVNAALGSATEYQDAICVNVGGGVGAAIKRNGRVQPVPGTWSCYEIGHGMRFALPEELTRTCRCGNIGCLEAAIGGWAMIERYHKRLEDAPPEMLHHMSEDVVEVLPQVIADFVRKTGISTVLMAGKGSTEYHDRDGDFLKRMRERTEDLLSDGRQVSFDLLRLAETAQLHGAVLALLDNGLLDPDDRQYVAS